MRTIRDVWKEAETHGESMRVESLSGSYTEYVYEGVKIIRFDDDEIVIQDMRCGASTYNLISTHPFLMHGWVAGCLRYNRRKLSSLADAIREEIEIEINTAKNSKRVKFLERKIDKITKKKSKYSKLIKLL